MLVGVVVVTLLVLSFLVIPEDLILWGIPEEFDIMVVSMMRVPRLARRAVVEFNEVLNWLIDIIDVAMKKSCACPSLVFHMSLVTDRRITRTLTSLPCIFPTHVHLKTPP